MIDIEHPDIARTIATRHPQEEPIIISECARCGQELQQGEEVVFFPGNEYNFCSDTCLIEQMLKEGNIEKVVLE
ncbi:hypothetical protein [Sporosarcina newyorkensis]|uniref:hypothetical protein n=1 Tax=Sporosarcina newyorkensis TaxID=759851 RepID=UPI003D074E45